MIDLTTKLFAPDEATSKIQFNTASTTSPFTGGGQTTEMPGARYVLKYSYSNVDLDKMRLFNGIFAVLRGGAVVAHITDFSAVSWHGKPFGTPVIAAADQTGATLQLSGFNSNTHVFKFGDKLSYLAIDGLYHLHTVVDDNVESDASGNATVKIMPPIHNSPKQGSYVETVNPVVSAVLSDSSEVSINGVITDTSLTFTEALYTME